MFQPAQIIKRNKPKLIIYPFFLACVAVAAEINPHCRSPKQKLEEGVEQEQSLGCGGKQKGKERKKSNKRKGCFHIIAK